MTSVAERSYDAKTVARFWSKVDKNGPMPAHMPHLGPCWVWTGARFPFGYGAFQLGSRQVPGSRRAERAHRFSWKLHNGDIGPLCVLHHCDNPSCVNPAHLFLGTIADNNHDRRAKGRDGKTRSPRPADSILRGERHYMRTNPELIPRGSARGCAKLTEEDVLRIRSMVACNVGYRTIADTFNVSRALICLIHRRRLWTHVP